MTLRDALGVDARHVYERVDEVLNSEDGIILLVDRPSSRHQLLARVCSIWLPDRVVVGGA